MAKIIFTNTNCSWNKGSAAQVISASRTLKRLISDADFTLVSYRLELDLKQCALYNIKVVGYSGENPHKGLLFSCRLLRYLLHLFRCGLWAVLHKIGLNASSLIDGKILREYAQADMIIDLSGDSFSDSLGGRSIMNSFTVLLGIFLGKPIVIYSQSIGPFKVMTMPLAKFCLNRVDLIIVREQITQSYLKTIGVDKPQIYLTAETAFLLKPAPHKMVKKILLKEGISKKKKPLIGISVSKLIDGTFKPTNLNNKYVTLMAQVVDYLIEKLNARVVFVPHVIKREYDDRFVARKVYQKVKNKDRTKMITNEYTPEELKGVIGQCDLFIGARMHANISAISMHVPTIAIAWSHKYYGIMRALGQEKYVCDFKTATFDELVSKINDAWSSRKEIKKTLMRRVKIQKELAVFSGKLVKNLLNSLKTA